MDPRNYDIVLTCHDDCLLNQYHPDFDDYIVTSADGHDYEFIMHLSKEVGKHRIWHWAAHPHDMLMHRSNVCNGARRWDWVIPFIEEKEVDAYARILTGLSCISWCLANGFAVHAAGIDNTYLRTNYLTENLPIFVSRMEYYHPAISFLALDQRGAEQDDLADRMSGTLRADSDGRHLQ